MWFTYVIYFLINFNMFRNCLERPETFAQQKKGREETSVYFRKFQNQNLKLGQAININICFNG